MVVANARVPSREVLRRVRYVALRPHPLSNPFSVAGGGREPDVAVDAFEYAWRHPEEPLERVAQSFAVRLASSRASPAQRRAAFGMVVRVARCERVALVCVCAPRRCHCDVIRCAMLDALADELRETVGPSVESRGSSGGSATRRRKRPRASHHAAPGGSGAGADWASSL